MKIPVRRSCISLIVLSALVEAIRANENENSTTESRQGRVNGRIVKLYSGYKPDPVLCTEEGFKADPVVCSVFYRCTKSSSGKFTIFKFQCGPGTVYDPATEVCNHPSSTNRSECGGMNSHVEEENYKENEIDQPELPSPISTIKPIFTGHASNGTSYTTFKVPNLNNLDKQSTENGYINKFTISSTPYHEETTIGKVQDINQHLVNYHWTDYKPQDKISTTTSFSILEKRQPCTSDGFMGDTEDCEKFYRCVSNSRGGFIRYEFVCSEPTVWDDHLQSCNHPWAVRNRRCGRASISNENHTEAFYPNNKISKEKLGEGGDAKLPANSNEDNSNFNKISANYGDRLNYVDKYSIEKEHINNDSHLNKPSMSNEYTSIETEGNFQYDDLNNNYNYGQKITEKVSENIDSGYINQVNHEHEPPTTVTIRTPVTLTSTTDRSNQSPIPENLPENNDYSDAFGPQQYATSPKPDISLLKTTLAPLINQRSDCISTGFIGDVNDCKKFYRCVDNDRGGFIKHEFSCGEGTVWDSETEVCNYAWAVKHCGNSIPSKDASSSTSYTPSSAPQNIYELEKTTTVLSIQTSTPQQEINDFDLGYGQQQGVLSTKKPDIYSETTTLKQIQDQTQNNCQTSGFIGDTNDCKKFYRCVDNGNGGFTKHEFTCGEGTVWDPDIEACNHARVVKHCGGSVPTKENNLGSSTSNVNVEDSSNGYITHNYIDNENTTPKTTSTAFPPTNIVTKSEITSSLSDIYSSSTTIRTQFISTSNVNEDIECAANGFMGDQNDCKKFYRCVDNGNGTYIKYIFSCGEGTLWDSEINACNHESVVKNCRSSTTSEISPKPSSNPVHDEIVDGYATPGYNNSDNLAESSTLHRSTTTSTTITEANDECKSSGFMGDNNDCHKFYRCVDNGHGGFIKHEFMCGEGTVWDSRIEACNHKWAVEKCGSNTHLHEIEKTTTTSTHSTSPVTESEFNKVTSTHSVTYSSSSTTILSTTPKVTKQPTDEVMECNSEGFFPNPNDCTKFYRCVDDTKDGYTKYEFSCADGTAWDVNTQSCNYINEVKTCHSNQHTNTTTTKPVYDEQITESDTKKTPTITTTTPKPSSTTAITTTSKTESTSTSTTASASTTAPAPSSTTSKTTMITEKPQPAEQNVCKEEGYFGNTSDCKKFYRCVAETDGKYTKYDFDCGDGTIWDQDIITCNHPRDVKNPSCKSESQSTSPATTTSSTTTNSETPITTYSTTTHKPSSSSTREPSSTTREPSSSTTDKPMSTSSEIHSNKNETNSNCTTENNNKNFTCTKAGFYADPSNCKKFYRCVDWENNGKKFSIYHFECSDGTIWDPALETCNHEESVYPPRNCNGSASSPTTTMESTTEKTTTQSTTTKNPTTQPSTTAKPTTQSSTTQETTTPTSTAQESTTQSSTTEESTTKSSTTEESTTQSSTTEESTTQSSTTQSSTTEESTTQSSTTQSSTTEESTTQSSTTEESTTQSSTTQSSTTEESTTQSSTTEESTTQSSTTQSSTTEESTTQSSTTEESTTQSSTTQSSTTDESTTQSSTTQSSTTEGSTTQSSTTEESTTQSTTDQTSTTESSNNKECPDTSKDQSLYVCPTSFKRHPKYCNLFYQCTDDNDSHEQKIAVFHCPNNTIYDESKVQCVEENKSSKKCKGQISQKHRVKRLGADQTDPFIVTKERMACLKTGHFPFEKQTNCSPALLKCELTKSGELRGFVYRCPDDFVYWNISRRCEPVSKVRDCKRSTYPWKRRYDIPLERFNIASET